MAGSRTLKLSILGDVDGLNKSLKTATNDVDSFGDRVGKAGVAIGKAFAAAAAAAGAAAIAIGIDSVKAAIADEKANKGASGHLEIKFMMTPHNREETLSLEEELKELPHFTDYCTWAIVPIRGGLDNKNSAPNQGSGSEVMEGYTKEDYILFGNRK
jgi:hypothetical protein